MKRMPTDFRDGKTFPRRGREATDGALWLLRISDKGRAFAAGTIHDYIYPCPMDQGVLERWGVSVDEFEAALRSHSDDAGMRKWLLDRVAPERISAANEWLLSEKITNLDRQDAEETVTNTA